jgi:hypothetical protein
MLPPIFTNAALSSSENVELSYNRTSEYITISAQVTTCHRFGALAVLADAVDRCREEDMRTAEVLASLEIY